MNEQVYIVVPAIEESDTLDIENLEKTFLNFSDIFQDFNVDKIHGKMSLDEKNHTFKKFRNNEINILVSTSVIEVGIHVENATVMAIFSPERFGLASLHQLRGRVGRGQKPGFFFLINEREISKESKFRLKILEDHFDGFTIAEKDLELRGEGDLLGKNQSGAKFRKIANINDHYEQMQHAIRDLDQIKKEWPNKYSILVNQETQELVEFTI